MFSRTAQVLLRQKYETETEAIRSDYEKAKNGLVSAEQKTDELERKQVILIDQNRKFIENSNKLKLSIEFQNTEISNSKTLLNNLHVKSIAIEDKNKVLKSDMEKLEKEKVQKLQEVKDVESILSNIKADVSRAAAFLNTLNNKINDKKLELEETKKKCDNRIVELDAKEKSLQILEKTVMQKDLDNVQESNRLNKYKERLNKYYEELGLNIKL